MKNLKRLSGIIFILITITGIAFAQSAPKEIKLKPAEKKLLNTFFSNFSEVFVEPFEKDEISDSALIQFSISHNYRNNYKFLLRGARSIRLKLNLHI